jgi:multiple sugar transport system substrate-binding protein
MRDQTVPGAARREARRDRARRTRRHLLSALAATGGAATLAACGQATGSGTPEAATARPAKISVLLGTAGAVPILDPLKESFRVAHPTISAEYEEISGTAQTQQKILTLAAAGSLPDVLPEHPNFVSDIAERGILADLGALAAKDRAADVGDFYAGILDHFRHKNVLHGFPWNSGPSIIYFNRSLLERLNVKPPDQREKEGKWDWTAFQEVARAATTGSGGTRTMGFQQPNLNLDWFDAWVWQAGGDVFNKDLSKCLLGEPNAVQAVQLMADLHTKDRVVPYGEEARDFPNGVESGKVALRFGNKDQAIEILKASEQSNFKPGLAPTPKGRGGRANRDGPQANGIAKTSPAPDAAWVYVKHMSNLETQKIRLAANLTTPVRKSAAKTTEFTKALYDWESAAFWQDAADTVRGLPKPAKYTDINTAWRATFDKILRGEQAVRQAMEDLARQVDALLAGG